MESLISKLKKSNAQPNNAVNKSIEQYRGGDYGTRDLKRKTTRCLSKKTNDRSYTHSICQIFAWPSPFGKWRTHWLPSYPLKRCCCGAAAAAVKKSTTTVATIFYRYLWTNPNYSIITPLSRDIQPLYYIVNLFCILKPAYP